MNTGHPIVDAISEIRLEGRLVPHAWRRHPKMRTPANRPYNAAIDLLADVVYFHRLTLHRDEQSGAVTHATKKFEADRYRIDYRRWSEENGYTKRQAQDAAAFLKKQGICKVEIDDHTTPTGHIIYNAVFITPIVQMILKLNDAPSSHPLPKIREGYPEFSGQVYRKTVTHGPKIRDSYTKSTAKNTQRKQQQANDVDAFDSLESSEPQSDTETDHIAQKLQALGVTLKVARQLAASSPAECLRQIELLPHRPQVKNPAPLLIAAIRDAYAAPVGYAETPVVAPLSEAETADRDAKRNAQLKHLENAAIRVLEAQSPSYLAALKKDKPNLNVVEYVLRIHTNELDAELRKP